jgi:hypothetical protein
MPVSNSDAGILGPLPKFHAVSPGTVFGCCLTPRLDESRVTDFISWPTPTSVRREIQGCSRRSRGTAAGGEKAWVVKAQLVHSMTLPQTSASSSPTAFQVRSRAAIVLETRETAEPALPRGAVVSGNPRRRGWREVRFASEAPPTGGVGNRHQLEWKIQTTATKVPTSKGPTHLVMASF